MPRWKKPSRLKPSEGGKMMGPVVGDMVKPNMVQVYGGPGGDMSCPGCGYHVCSCVHDPVADMQAVIEQVQARTGPNGFPSYEPQVYTAFDAEEPEPRPFKVGDRVEKWQPVAGLERGSVTESDPLMVSWISDRGVRYMSRTKTLRHAAPVGDHVPVGAVDVDE